MREYHEHGFPATIIRPSLTYGLSQIPLAGASWLYPYTVIDRIRKGKKIIIPATALAMDGHLERRLRQRA